MTEAVPVNETHFSRLDAGKEYMKPLDLLVDGEFKTFKLVVAEYFPSNTFTGADKKQIKEPCIGFTTAKKKMILNSTNQEVLHLVTGQSNGYKTVGHEVRVEARVVSFGSEAILGLRIMPTPGTLMRKGLKKHLGAPAKWQGPATDNLKQAGKESNAQTEAGKTDGATDKQGEH